MSSSTSTSTQASNLLRHLPVRLASAQTGNNQAIAEYLVQELDCPAIRSLYLNMRWVGKRSVSNIDPLHHHVVEGRHVVVTEEADLHLVWYKDIIYIKPLPLWLLDA